MGMFYKDPNKEIREYYQREARGPGWEEIEELRRKTRDTRTQITEAKILYTALRKKDELLQKRITELGQEIIGLKSRMNKLEKRKHARLRNPICGGE